MMMMMTMMMMPILYVRKYFAIYCQKLDSLGYILSVAVWV